MKKQINPTTKAHLIRGAFYLLLLVAVCAHSIRAGATKRRQVKRDQAGDPHKCDCEHSAAGAAFHRGGFCSDAGLGRSRGSGPPAHIAVSSKGQWCSWSAHNPDSATAESSTDGSVRSGTITLRPPPP